MRSEKREHLWMPGAKPDSRLTYALADYLKVHSFMLVPVYDIYIQLRHF